MTRVHNVGTSKRESDDKTSTDYERSIAVVEQTCNSKQTTRTTTVSLAFESVTTISHTSLRQHSTKSSRFAWNGRGSFSSVPDVDTDHILWPLPWSWRFRRSSTTHRYDDSKPCKPQAQPLGIGLFTSLCDFDAETQAKARGAHATTLYPASEMG
jgi:hypothetical protein